MIWKVIVTGTMQRVRTKMIRSIQTRILFYKIKQPIKRELYIVEFVEKPLDQAVPNDRPKCHHDQKDDDVFGVDEAVDDELSRDAQRGKKDNQSRLSTG